MTDRQMQKNRDRSRGGGQRGGRGIQIDIYTGRERPKLRRRPEREKRDTDRHTCRKREAKAEREAREGEEGYR